MGIYLGENQKIRVSFWDKRGVFFETYGSEDSEVDLTGAKNIDLENISTSDPFRIEMFFDDVPVKHRAGYDFTVLFRDQAIVPNRSWPLKKLRSNGVILIKVYRYREEKPELVNTIEIRYRNRK